MTRMGHSVVMSMWHLGVLPALMSLFKFLVSLHSGFQLDVVLAKHKVNLTISNYFKAVNVMPDNTALSFVLFNYLKRAVILCEGLTVLKMFCKTFIFFVRQF